MQGAPRERRRALDLRALRRGYRGVEGRLARQARRRRQSDRSAVAFSGSWSAVLHGLRRPHEAVRSSSILSASMATSAEQCMAASNAFLHGLAASNPLPVVLERLDVVHYGPLAAFNSLSIRLTALGTVLAQRRWRRSWSIPFGDRLRDRGFRGFNLASICSAFARTGRLGSGSVGLGGGPSSARFAAPILPTGSASSNCASRAYNEAWLHLTVDAAAPAAAPPSRRVIRPNLRQALTWASFARSSSLASAPWLPQTAAYRRGPVALAGRL